MTAMTLTRNTSGEPKKVEKEIATLKTRRWKRAFYSFFNNTMAFK